MIKICSFYFLHKNTSLVNLPLCNGVKSFSTPPWKGTLYSWEFSPRLRRATTLRGWPSGRAKNVLNGNVLRTHDAIMNQATASTWELRAMDKIVVSEKTQIVSFWNTWAMRKREDIARVYMHKYQWKKLYGSFQPIDG